MAESRKKLLFLITKSNWSGAQKYVHNLAVSLSPEYDVSVAFGGGGVLGNEPPGQLKTKLEEAGVRTIFVPELMRDVHHLHELKSVWALYKLLRQEAPDILHVNSSKAGGEGAFAGRLAGVKNIVYTVHGLPENEDRSSIQKFLIKFATWLTFILVSKIITITKQDFEDAKKYFGCGKKVFLVYNGIEPMALSGGEVIREAFPAGVKITGTVGELNKNKNQIALIEQAHVNPDMYVAIVGEGEERASLENAIAKYDLEDRVKLFGFVPANEVLRGFDTFALPSIKEGLPYVLLEAKMAGLPIVANRVGAVGEILDAKDMSEFSMEKMLEKTRTVYEN